MAIYPRNDVDLFGTGSPAVEPMSPTSVPETSPTPSEAPPAPPAPTAAPAEMTDIYAELSQILPVMAKQEAPDFGAVLRAVSEALSTPNAAARKKVFDTALKAGFAKIEGTQSTIMGNQRISA